MTVTSEMNGGYPDEATIEAYLAARGIELLTQNNPNWLAEFKQLMWGLVNATDWASALGVYAPSATTFNVRGGEYYWAGTVKTYTPGAAVDPTDNDTTYVWLTSSNAIGSGIDGSGWPTSEHIKLAEVDVDSSGNITAIRDLRGQTFLQYLANVVVGDGASAIVSPATWESATPADDDEMRMPFYGDNDAAEAVEYARLTVKFTDVSDGSEDAEVLLSTMIAGALTSLGNIVGATATQILTNKTIDCASNTVSNVGSAECETYDAAGGGLTFLLKATIAAGADVTIHDANAPFKYRILDAWSVAASADGGSWKLTDGSNDISDTVTVTGTDKTIDRIGTIDDAYHEIVADGTLTVDADGVNADCEVYIMCMRVS